MSTKSHSGPLGTFSAQLTFAWTLIFLILALGAVSGRLYSRFLKRANLGLDDLLIVAAFVAFTAQGVLVFICEASLLPLMTKVITQPKLYSMVESDTISMNSRHRSRNSLSY